MSRHVVLFTLLFAVLIALIWLLFADRAPYRTHSPYAASPPSSLSTPKESRPTMTPKLVLPLKTDTKNGQQLTEDLKYPEASSESDPIDDDTISSRQNNYPEKPEVPEFDMPIGQEIMPFSYQRLRFKNAPDDEQIGLALYVTLSDPEKRKLAFLHRNYLHQLTAFLASNYDHNAVQTDEGKRVFLDMLEVRFKRRAKGGLIQALDSAYFDTAP